MQPSDKHLQFEHENTRSAVNRMTSILVLDFPGTGFFQLLWTTLPTNTQHAPSKAIADQLLEVVSVPLSAKPDGMECPVSCRRRTCMNLLLQPLPLTCPKGKKCSIVYWVPNPVNAFADIKLERTHSTRNTPTSSSTATTISLPLPQLGTTNLRMFDASRRHM